MHALCCAQQTTHYCSVTGEGQLDHITGGLLGFIKAIVPPNYLGAGQHGRSEFIILVSTVGYLAEDNSANNPYVFSAKDKNKSLEL